MGEQKTMIEQQPKPNTIDANREQSLKQLAFVEGLKDFFSGTNWRGNRAAKAIGDYIDSPNRLTNEWWTDLFTKLHDFDYHGNPVSLAQLTFESLDALPPHIKLPRYMEWWISHINDGSKKEPERKQIVDALRNPAIPLSLRVQLGKQLAEAGVNPYSADNILKAYEVLGDNVKEEVGKQILPLFIAVLAHDQYDLYREDFVNLLKEQPALKKTTPEKQSFLPKAISLFKSKIHKDPQLSEAESMEKRKFAERRAEVIRNLVLELFPPIPENQNAYQPVLSKRLGDYDVNNREEREAASSDMLTLPIETLEKYLADLRQLKELPEFTNLSSRFFSEKGIVPPYTALGESSSDWHYEKQIPIISILHHLNKLDKSGKLDDRIVNEIALGIRKHNQLFQNDTINKISPEFRRNLRFLMSYQLPEDTRMLNIPALLTIRKEDVLQDVLDTAASMVLEAKADANGNQIRRDIFYLTSKEALDRLDYLSMKKEDVDIFLQTYKTLPPLESLHQEFCRQYMGGEQGKQTAQFFKDMSTSYSSFPDQTVDIIKLVDNSGITRERALELPTKASNVLSSPAFPMAIRFPKLFLETDAGLDFFTQVNTASLFSLDKGLTTEIREKINSLPREGEANFTNLLFAIAPREIQQIDKLLSSDSQIEANQQNWQQLLMAYVQSNAQHLHSLPPLSQASTDRINALFNDPKVRDLCLNGLRDSWVKYLESGKPKEIPFSLNAMSVFIDMLGGVGPLSQLGSLTSLISRVDLVFAQESTAERTKLEICQGIATMENRFTKERWSNEDRTDFYNISHYMLGAAPSLFSDYLGLFERLTSSQMKLFAKDIYPLYRTKLVLMEREDKPYDVKQLVQIRKDIRNFADIFNDGENSFGIQKQKLLEEIKSLFEDRFGISKIPQEFNSENMRSFTNVTTYLSNLNGRTPEKETVLGFYLSLMLNDRWDNFRTGETIDPSEYLTPEKSNMISKFLEERQRLNPLVPENLGILQEDMPEFLKLLQQETQNMVVGNIETIDVKLTNIILNLRGLEDLDLYPDPLDKQRMQLLLNWGNKRVGSVVAKMYQSLALPGKIIQFSDEDTKIQQRVTHAIQELGLSLTPQTLKEHFQDGIKPLATVVNLFGFANETQAESEVESLRDLLKPSPEVIEVFKRLGEDFKPTSGALALSQDLSYLDNLIVKREDELQPQEKTLLMQYTANIRTQIVKLEGLYGQIKNKFGSLKQGNNNSKNPLLQDKLNQIDGIINVQTTQQAITSTATNNLNVIIENIRECLSCTRGGGNNDTDLTFGDMNKFYLYSQSETQRGGSISDQLVFVEPVTKSDGTQEITFVLDRIYGINTPTILENQIEAMLKKYRAIKQRFPSAKLSVFVSDAAISTGGTSTEMLLEKFKSKNIPAIAETVEVNVAESAAGDHYIEFGGNSRSSGKRNVKGIAMRF